MDLYREEPFRAGLDEGLKAWLRMRKELRDARRSGYNGEMTLPRGRFRYKKYWDDKIPFRCKREDENWNDDDAGRRPWQDEDRDFLQSLQNTHKHHAYITDQVALTALEMRHERHLGWLVDFMRANGGGLNQQFTANRRTMLHIAAMRGDTFKTHLLLMAGANPNIRDTNRDTALHLALREPRRFHSLELLNDLINSGADLEAKNRKGHTPLHVACILGDTELMEVLLSRGCSVTARDKKKKMAIEYAFVRNCIHDDHRASISEVRAAFDKYRKVVGHRKLQRMWARVISVKFMTQLIEMVTPTCPKCKRKVTTCGEIKRNNYRHWLLLHNKVPI